MPLVATDAIVLHVFDYLESSRVLRLATRDAGVRSAIAKGARRSPRRFSGGLDLFSRGIAQLYTKPGRDLDTLAGFDDLRSTVGLAADLGRFIGASAIAELTLRFSREASADSALYDAVASRADGCCPRARAARYAPGWPANRRCSPTPPKRARINGCSASFSAST